MSAELMVGDTVVLGKYPQDATECPVPIEWLVAECNESECLLLCKKGIECVPYHAVFESVDWEGCTLRHWLGNGFLKRAFGQAERAALSPREVPLKDCNGDSKGHVVDVVSLLSIEQFERIPYGMRKCEPTERAVANGAFVPMRKNGDGHCCYWWLIDGGAKPENAAMACADGSLYKYGEFVDAADTAVRPAIIVPTGLAKDLAGVAKQLAGGRHGE